MPRAERASAELAAEGMMVADLSGTDPLRRRAFHGAGRGGSAERGLPASYEQDLLLMLPRDPSTLFVFWDFRASTLEEAVRGLDAPRFVLRVYDGQALAREQQFTPGDRRLYVEGLPPGRAYRLEVAVVGASGESRVVTRSPRWITLPPMGPSLNGRYRRLSLPWTEPLKGARQRILESERPADVELALADRAGAHSPAAHGEGQPLWAAPRSGSSWPGSSRLGP